MLNPENEGVCRILVTKYFIKSDLSQNIFPCIFIEGKVETRTTVKWCSSVHCNLDWEKGKQLHAPILISNTQSFKYTFVNHFHLCPCMFTYWRKEIMCWTCNIQRIIRHVLHVFKTYFQPFVNFEWWRHTENKEINMFRVIFY